jgi:hypothetical protein
MGGLARYTQTIPARQSVKIGARGRTIVVRDVVGELRVSARSNQVGPGGGETYTLILRKFEKWFCEGEFDEVEAFNDTDETLSIDLLIGYGDFVREVTSRSSVSKFLTAISAKGTNYDFNGVSLVGGIVLYVQAAA